jgi:hypothetical protein
MREIIQNLNKHTLADATGISYSKLRKFSAGIVKDLTDAEKKAIYDYLINIANNFKVE